MTSQTRRGHSSLQRVIVPLCSPMKASTTDLASHNPSQRSPPYMVGTQVILVDGPTTLEWESPNLQLHRLQSVEKAERCIHYREGKWITTQPEHLANIHVNQHWAGRWISRTGFINVWGSSLRDSCGTTHHECYHSVCGLSVCISQVCLWFHVPDLPAVLAHMTFLFVLWPAGLVILWIVVPQVRYFTQPGPSLS